LRWRQEIRTPAEPDPLQLRTRDAALRALQAEQAVTRQALMRLVGLLDTELPDFRLRLAALIDRDIEDLARQPAPPADRAALQDGLIELALALRLAGD
jgi:hypothetical protein